MLTTLHSYRRRVRRWQLSYSYVNKLLPYKQTGHAVVQLVEALRYKSEGRGFDSDVVIGIFH
jgi:hypothetical protein